MSSERFLHELRAEVLDAAERRGNESHRPKPQLARLAAVAAVALAVVAGFVIARPGTAAANVEITRDGADLVVRITETDVDAAEIEQAAASAGIAVAVTEEPVGPSLVGRFIGSSATELPPLIEVVEGDPASGFVGFRIPATYEGSLTLRLGREARDGEEWAALSDATAPGEVLECGDLHAVALTEVAEAARRQGAQLRVLSLDLGRWWEGDELDEHADDIRLSSPEPGVVWADVSAHPENFQIALDNQPSYDGC